MQKNVIQYLSKIEITWALVWSVFLFGYYILLSLQSSANLSGLILLSNFLLYQYSLQILFILASILSLFIYFINFNQEKNHSDIVSEGARLVFSLVNLCYYILDIFDLNFLNLNFSYLWLILPWMLWIPIIIDSSNRVKQELSWIK